MAYTFYLVLVLPLMTLVLRDISALTCMQCDDIPLPSLCRYVKQCGSHEVCSIEGYVSATGHIKYKQTCTDRQFCGSVTRKRDDRNIFCSECCTGDLCNSGGCNKQGFSLDFGSICYNCDDDLQIGPKGCDKIAQCGRDEICQITPVQKTGFPANIDVFRTKCVNRNDDHCTRSPSVDVLGRRVVSECGYCCENYLCNAHDPRRCSVPHVTTTTFQTAASTTTEATTIITPTQPGLAVTTTHTSECRDLWHCPSNSTSFCKEPVNQICCPKTCITCDIQGTIHVETPPRCLSPATTDPHQETSTLQTTTGSFLCRDNLRGCDTLTLDVFCVGDNEAWARSNCAKTCKFCT